MGPPATSRLELVPRPILVLPPDVAERIAAGEVIDRPASVVRELLDNAVDAGATEVRVELLGGGLELIRVSDDGWGIPADEVELAFQRHATSKIRDVDDLFRLGTLGFRGEALPSIAAVAEVSMLTREVDAETGTSLVVRGGELARRTVAARQPGTTVSVRHLFHNVPARLKFLPAARGESLLVGQLVRRYALAHPSIRFSLLLDRRLSFQSGGSGRLETALAEVYGPAVAAAMLPVGPLEAEGATLGGFVSNRLVTRPGRQHVQLFVNRRWVANRGLLAAVEAAYRPLLPRGRHPIATLTLELPPDELDPNIHPAKTEVKLLREAAVAERLAAAVREALERTPARPSTADDFALGGRQYALPTPRRRLAEAPAGWSRLFEDEEPLIGALPKLRIVSQVQRSLILAEGPGGLYLVDQHRAHERIVYEQLQQSAGGRLEGQGLLEPLVLELRPAQAAALEARLPELEALGLHCELFGGRSYLVRAVPAVLAQGDLAEGLQGLLEEAAAEDDGWRERLLASLACRAAVRRNRVLEAGQMRELMRDLARTRAPAACPHGSPLILHFGTRFLRRQFGW